MKTKRPQKLTGNWWNIRIESCVQFSHLHRLLLELKSLFLYLCASGHHSTCSRHCCSTLWSYIADGYYRELVQLKILLADTKILKNNTVTSYTIVHSTAYISWRTILDSMPFAIGSSIEHFISGNWPQCHATNLH